MTFFRSASLLAVILFTVVVMACDQGSPVAQVCYDIPTNGCPLDGAGTECEDACCQSVYACVNGAWSLDHTCPSYVPGGCPDAAAPAVPDAGEYRDVSDFDVPPGASGNASCVDPQAPDCWISEALLCNPNSTDPCCGCSSLFYCDNGNTVLWGTCSDDGGVTQGY